MAEFSYILKKHYQTYFDTLKNTSHDNENNVYMCQSRMQVINFDNLTKDLNPKKQPASFDALLSDEVEKRVYCVEFKNQDKSKINNVEIQKKLADGRVTLDEMLRRDNIAKKDYEFVFCVAFKPNSQHYKYRRKIEARETYFNLQKYEDKFDKIITNDIDFFTAEFTRKYRCD